MFEALRENTKPEVSSMLDRLEARINAKEVEKSPVEQALEKVTKGIVEAKKYFDANPNFIETASAEQLAEYTNAWFAWGKYSFFKGPEHKALRVSLQSLLTRDSAEERFARQVWRTHMVSYFAEKLMASKRTDKAEVMERLMAGQIVSAAENEPHEALYTGRELDKALEPKEARDEISQEMLKSTFRGTISDIGTGKALGTAYSVNEVKVVVGGALYSFNASNLELAQAFEFKNMVLDTEHNRIYAQMKNGCRGNLVIIELSQPQLVLPPVQPPMQPGPTPEPKKGEGRGETTVRPPRTPEPGTGEGSTIVRPPRPGEGGVGEGSTTVRPPRPREGGVGEGSTTVRPPRRPQPAEGTGVTETRPPRRPNDIMPGESDAIQ